MEPKSKDQIVQELTDLIALVESTLRTLSQAKDFTMNAEWDEQLGNALYQTFMASFKSKLSQLAN